VTEGKKGEGKGREGKGSGKARRGVPHFYNEVYAYGSLLLFIKL